MVKATLELLSSNYFLQGRQPPCKMSTRNLRIGDCRRDEDGHTPTNPRISAE